MMTSQGLGVADAVRSADASHASAFCDEQDVEPEACLVTRRWGDARLGAASAGVSAGIDRVLHLFPLAGGRGRGPGNGHMRGVLLGAVGLRSGGHQPVWIGRPVPRGW